MFSPSRIHNLNLFPTGGGVELYTRLSAGDQRHDSGGADHQPHRGLHSRLFSRDVDLLRFKMRIQGFNP